MMFSKALLTGLTAGLLLTASFAQAGQFAIRDNLVKYDAERYFRYAAQDVRLGSYGNKRSPVGGKNGLEKTGNLDKVLLKGNWKKGKLVTITDVKKTQLNVKGSIEDPVGTFGLSGDDFYSLTKSGDCKFRKVFVDDLNDLARAINKNNQAFNRLKNQKRPRVVTSVLLVDHCTVKSESQIRHNGSFKGVIKGLKISVNPSLSSGEDETIEYDPRTVLGYVLDEPKFDKRPKKATKIKSWKHDQKGIK